MKHNLNKIFEHTDCIDFNTLKSYADKTLADSESRQVEIHLLSCPVCQDMLEGYECLPDKIQLPLIVNSLNQKIDNRIKNRIKPIIPVESRFKPGEKKISLRIKRILAVAASLLLIMAAGFWVNNLRQNSADMAVNVKSETLSDKFSEPKETSTDAFVNNNENADELSDNELIADDSVSKKTVILPEKSDNEMTEPGNDNIKTETVSMPASASLITIVKEDDADVEDSEENMSEDDATLATEPVSDYIVEEKEPETEKTEAPSSVFMGAMRTVSTGSETDKTQKKENRKKNNVALKVATASGNSKDAELLLKSGRSLYEAGDFKSAITRFDKVIDLGGKYTTEAKWWKALSLIESDKKIDALLLLDELSSTDNSFKDKALEKIKELR